MGEEILDERTFGANSFGWMQTGGNLVLLITSSRSLKDVKKNYVRKEELEKQRRG